MVTPEQQSRVKTRPVELIIKLFALIRMAADYPSKPARFLRRASSIYFRSLLSLRPLILIVPKLSSLKNQLPPAFPGKYNFVIGARLENVQNGIFKVLLYVLGGYFFELHIPAVSCCDI